MLPGFADGCFQLVYADPPFNTGRRQGRVTMAVEARPDGDRMGFAGRRYATHVLRRSSFADAYDDYLGFLEPRLRELHRLLAPTGTLYLHLDYREAHYAKVLLDRLFGRECFLNEIVWAYDYGGRPRRRWPAKHDTILVYVKDPERYWFDAEAVEREPYMAPGLSPRRKRSAASFPRTSGGTRSSRRRARRRRAIRRRSRRGSSAGSSRPPPRPGDWCLDPFAGSGTLGAVCARLDRHFVLIDSSPEAVEVAQERLARFARPEAGVRANQSHDIPGLDRQTLDFADRSVCGNGSRLSKEKESRGAWFRSSSRQRPSTSRSAGSRSPGCCVRGLSSPRCSRTSSSRSPKRAPTRSGTPMQTAGKARSRSATSSPTRPSRSRSSTKAGASTRRRSSRARASSTKGGLGIAIIRALTDDLSIGPRAGGSGSCVRFTKNLRAEPEPAWTPAARGIVRRCAAPSGQRRHEAPGRLRVDRFAGPDGPDPGARRAARGQAGAAPLGDRVRRRRRRDPLHAGAAHARRRARRRVARDPGPGRVLRRHEDDSQRAAGRSPKPHTRAAGDLQALPSAERRGARGPSTTSSSSTIRNPSA